MGWSDGGVLALGAAADSDSVAAVAVFELGVWSLMGEDDAASFGATVSKWTEATAQGRLLDAAHIFHHFVCTDDEFGALGEGYLDQQASLFPLLMEELQKGMFSPGPQPTDPEVLSRIDVPVLALLAQRPSCPLGLPPPRSTSGSTSPTCSSTKSLALATSPRWSRLNR